MQKYYRARDNKMKYAVCAVIIKDGLILATHRRDNKNDWGLPGGKVDTNA